MSKKIRIIIIIIFNLFIFARLGNYISVQIIRFDDCIIDIQINNDKFEFTPKEYNSCQRDNFPNSLNSKDFLLKNYEYKFNDKIEFSFGDSDHTEGWMQTNIYFNEYIIQTKDRVFWKCKNCEGNDNNYIIEDENFPYENKVRGYWDYVDKAKEKIFFYKIPGNSTRDTLFIYYFYFVIHDITDLYKGAFNGEPFTVNHTFFTLGSQNNTFEFTIYAPQNELELINFNVPENFHVTDNNTLLGEYTNYYFEVEGYNNVEGNLKGLDLYNNNMHYLNEEDHTFKVTDTIGLKYELSENEIKNKNDIYINIKITAFIIAIFVMERKLLKKLLLLL